MNLEEEKLWLLPKLGEKWQQVPVIRLADHICARCGEDFLAEEFVQFMPPETYWHRECAMRSIVGSVGHQKRECSCYGGVGDGDPPGLSAREAARAAYEYYLETHPE